MKEGEQPSWKKQEQIVNPSYFSIFAGQTARLSAIERESPRMVGAVRSLIKSGHCIGQDIFDETGQVDTLVKLSNAPPTPMVFNHEPLPRTPEEIVVPQHIELKPRNI